MKLTSEQQQIVSLVDFKVRSLLEKGSNETEILAALANDMPEFKHLMDTVSRQDMETLSQQYDGFGHYARLLGALAKAIAAGDIDVPA